MCGCANTRAGSGKIEASTRANEARLEAIQGSGAAGSNGELYILGYAMKLPRRKSSTLGVKAGPHPTAKPIGKGGGLRPPGFAEGGGRSDPQNRRVAARKLYCVTQSSRFVIDKCGSSGQNWPVDGDTETQTRKGKPAGIPRKTIRKTTKSYRNSGIRPRPEGDLHQSP